MFFKIPKEREVPFGGIIKSPVKDNRGMITGNWRTERPIIDHELCTLCLNCYIFCPDACWTVNDEEEKMVWNADFCKGCLVCKTECSEGALSAANELDFDDGVIRLEKPF